MEVVNVIYRNVDGVHVFTSEDVRGLYVADRDPRRAYEDVPEALHEMMKFKGVEASYSPDMSTEEFLRFIGYLTNDIPHPSVLAAQNVLYNRAA